MHFGMFIWDKLSRLERNGDSDDTRSDSGRRRSQDHEGGRGGGASLQTSGYGADPKDNR